jgi:hypothetical protein
MLATACTQLTAGTQATTRTQATAAEIQEKINGGKFVKNT